MKPEINKGIFLPTDISLIFNLPANKVNRWLNNYWTDDVWQTDKSKAVNFNTLLEFYIFYSLSEKGMSASKIKKSHEFLSEKFNCKYPFIKYNVYTDGNSVFTEKNEGQFINVDLSAQYEIPEFLIPFVDKIEFNNENIAVRFYPLGKDSEIVIDPELRFGEPVIKGTRISTSSIYSFYKAGETTEFISKIYDLSEKTVKDVVQFHSKAA